MPVGAIRRPPSLNHLSFTRPRKTDLSQFIATGDCDLYRSMHGRTDGSKRRITPVWSPRSVLEKRKRRRSQWNWMKTLVVDGVGRRRWGWKTEGAKCEKGGQGELKLTAQGQQDSSQQPAEPAPARRKPSPSACVTPMPQRLGRRISGVRD
jgi:hypothetical protein